MPFSLLASVQDAQHFAGARGPAAKFVANPLVVFLASEGIHHVYPKGTQKEYPKGTQKACFGFPSELETGVSEGIHLLKRYLTIWVSRLRRAVGRWERLGRVRAAVCRWQGAVATAAASRCYTRWVLGVLGSAHDLKNNQAEIKFWIEEIKFFKGIKL